VAVAPEAGGEGAALVGFGLGLLSLLMWMVLRGLKGAWQLSFSPILEGLASIFTINVWRFHLHPLSKLTDLDHFVINSITEAALGYEQAMGFWFHQSARLQSWIASETWGLARDSLHFGSWLVHAYVPAAIHDATHLLGRATHTLTHVVTRVERVVVHTPAVAKAAAHAAVAPLYRTVAIPHLGELQWIHHHWKALTRAAAVAGGLALPRPDVWPKFWQSWRTVERWNALTKRRLERLEALLGATAMAAAMANVLGLRNPRCLRSGPLGKVSRALCGLSSNALNDVLGLLVDVLVISEICEVIPLMEQGFNVIAEPLSGLIGEAGAALCGGDFDPPPTLSLPTLSLPALVGVTAVEV